MLEKVHILPSFFYKRLKLNISANQNSAFDTRCAIKD